MTVLPIVERELRVAARRRFTYWIRVVLALGVMGIGGWVLLAAGSRTPPRVGAGMFVAMSICAFGYCLLAGLWTTADCLSREKREGTLGLLFLTDLKGYDIVLGKLAATSRGRPAVSKAFSSLQSRQVVTSAVHSCKPAIKQWTACGASPSSSNRSRTKLTSAW